MQKIKIKKELPKVISIIVLISLLLLFLILDVILYYNDNVEQKTILLIVSITIEFMGLAYFIIQDIICIKRRDEKKVYFDNDGIEKEFSFIDRINILNSIKDEVTEISETKRNKRINNCIIKQIESKSGNGKRTLCKKIVNMFYNCKKIQYTDFVDICTEDDLNNYFKTHTFIKFRPNVVVINMRIDFTEKLEKIKDKDIIFIIILHSNNPDSEKLDFSAEDVCSLIKTWKRRDELKDIKAENEANLIVEITKNINEIIIILKQGGSIYFDDKKFIKFYDLINNMNYFDALEYYDDNIKGMFCNSLGKLKAEYEYANIFHFLGKYSKSIEMLEILRVKLSETDSSKRLILKDVINLLAHVNKHIGEFSYSLNLLKQFEYLNLTPNKSFFSILIFCYNQSFLDTNYNNHLSYLNELGEKLIFFEQQRNEKNEEYYFYETYYPVYLCYKNNFSTESLNTALTYIDEAIKYYEKKYKRFLTNCYFLKAEIYRHCQKWDNAEEYYLKCLKIYIKNNDKDILYMLSVTFEMINIFYNKPFTNIPYQLNFEYCLKECSKNDEYSFHKQLFYYTKQCKQDNKIYKFLENYFLNIINPIP